jgi:hypothetical protein
MKMIKYTSIRESEALQNLGQGKSPRQATKHPPEALVDLVKCERANRSHHAIEEALVTRIKRKGHDALSNANIDVFFKADDGAVIIEVKSCNETNVHAQIRKAVSQLLEYSYVYSDELSESVHLAIALEAAPGVNKSWLIDYLRTLNIAVAWFDQANDKFESLTELPKPLRGVFDC